jgi:hypothetical protein
MGMSGVDSSFAERYGPWAIVLDDVARSISAETEVETRAVAIDLAGADAFDRVVDAATTWEAPCSAPRRIRHECRRPNGGR